MAHRPRPIARELTPLPDHARWHCRQSAPDGTRPGPWSGSAQYDTLLHDQQDLLAQIGLSADRARSAAARPAENEAGFATGLGYARSYHAARGTTHALPRIHASPH
ncbi:hypothetical protein AB0C96_14760 [Streptomyces sp. NPDC048506]|uniref:hypothetical protein n=1 Tax=Streptomyces sp. NPDC048506 TaxID=3155028 RepID=UPI00343E274E